MPRSRTEPVYAEVQKGEVILTADDWKRLRSGDD
jgi:hypothetical protein